MSHANLNNEPLRKALLMKPNVYRVFTRYGPVWAAHCVECGNIAVTPSWHATLAIANAMAVAHAATRREVGA